MKVLFGLTVLDHGGAERVLVDLANKLCAYHDITILTLYPQGDFLKELNSKIEVKSIYNKRYEDMNYIEKKIISLNMLLGFMRKRIYKKFVNDQYDLNIAFLEGPITWIFRYGNKRKIAWIHNNIESIFYGDKIKKSLNYHSYLKYDELVFVSQDNMEAFKKSFPKINIKKQVIRNYIDTKRIKKFALEDFSFKTTPNLVQVSRLTKQKNVERLIKVHQRLIEDNYYHHIYVLGDGPLKEDLEKLIKDKKLESTFHLVGRVLNPYPYIKAADAFILTSNFEGYGMVVVEAKILNKRILITDTEAREALDDYENKIIVDNNDSGIYYGIKELLVTKNNKNNSFKYVNDECLEIILNLIGDKK